MKKVLVNLIFGAAAVLALGLLVFFGGRIPFDYPVALGGGAPVTVVPPPGEPEHEINPPPPSEPFTPPELPDERPIVRDSAGQSAGNVQTKIKNRLKSVDKSV